MSRISVLQTLHDKYFKKWISHYYEDYNYSDLLYQDLYLRMYFNGLFNRLRIPTNYFIFKRLSTKSFIIYGDIMFMSSFSTALSVLTYQETKNLGIFLIKHNYYFLPYYINKIFSNISYIIQNDKSKNVNKKKKLINKKKFNNNSNIYVKYNKNKYSNNKYNKYNNNKYKHNIILNKQKIISISQRKYNTSHIKKIDYSKLNNQVKNDDKSFFKLMDLIFDKKNENNIKKLKVNKQIQNVIKNNNKFKSNIRSEKLKIKDSILKHIFKKKFKILKKFKRLKIKLYNKKIKNFKNKQLLNKLNKLGKYEFIKLNNFNKKKYNIIKNKYIYLNKYYKFKKKNFKYKKINIKFKKKKFKLEKKNNNLLFYKLILYRLFIFIECSLFLKYNNLFKNKNKNYYILKINNINNKFINLRKIIGKNTMDIYKKYFSYIRKMKYINYRYLNKIIKLNLKKVFNNTLYFSNKKYNNNKNLYYGFLKKNKWNNKYIKKYGYYKIYNIIRKLKHVFFNIYLNRIKLKFSKLIINNKKIQLYNQINIYNKKHYYKKQLNIDIISLILIYFNTNNYNLSYKNILLLINNIFFKLNIFLSIKTINLNLKYFIINNKIFTLYKFNNNFYNSFHLKITKYDIKSNEYNIYINNYYLYIFKILNLYLFKNKYKFNDWNMLLLHIMKINNNYSYLNNIIINQNKLIYLTSHLLLFYKNKLLLKFKNITYIFYKYLIYRKLLVIIHNK
jgi:hypothetical protein